jgi:hypothetical protein
LELTGATISNVYDETVSPLVLPLCEIAAALRAWTAHFPLAPE